MIGKQKISHAYLGRANTETIDMYTETHEECLNMQKLWFSTKS